MKKIRLKGKYGDGKFALVDDEDFKYLKNYVWFVNDQNYALTSITQNGKGKNHRMHRMIMQTPEGMDTDHINRDKLDNRRSNLRIVTRTQNNYNTGVHRTNTSGYKGVSWFKPAGLWRAYIGGSKARKELGYFHKIEDAVKARKQAELEIYE